MITNYQPPLVSDIHKNSAFSLICNTTNVKLRICLVHSYVHKKLHALQQCVVGKKTLNSEFVNTVY